MVVQDGGAHLRSSGAEDLLHWTDAQWEKQRARGRKELTLPVSEHCTALPRKAFPGYPSAADEPVRAIFQSQY